MQSEEFDNKTKDAAERHHPAYDEKAWEKMEKLLNKHLPQEKDDRKAIALILLFILLLGGTAYLLISRPWQSSKQVASTHQEAAIKKDNTASNEIPKEDKSAGPKVDEVSKPGSTNHSVSPVEPGTTKNPTRILQPVKGDAVQKPVNNTAIIDDNKLITSVNKTERNKPEDQSLKKVQEKKDNTITTPTKNDKVSIPRNEKADIVQGDIPESPPKISDKKSELTNEVANPFKNPKTEPLQPVKSSKETTSKNKENRKRDNSLFFTLSAGPNVSAAGDQLGRLKLMAGAGLGYNLGRFTLRAGIYSSRMIYTAEPYAYHPPDYFWTLYPDLKKVDGDCQVTEIPVSVAYNFNSTARQNWFASAGLSSYLMKRETYDYLYKNATGQLQNWKATIHNANKHYFSVLTLSGGYQRKINNTISVMAEPFVKIPMIGLGYGKVKLGSAGMLITVGIHPFHSTKSGRSSNAARR